MSYNGSGYTKLPPYGNIAPLLLSRSSQSRSQLSRSSSSSAPLPQAPYMVPIPLPSATPSTVQMGLPPSGHAGHYIPPSSSALYVSHSRPVNMDIHPLIAMPAQIVWDVSIEPKKAKMRGVRVASHILQTQATQPPTPDLTVCIMLRSEQKLHINASTPGGFVTVGEVLQRIYIFLQQPIPNAVVAGMSLRRRQSVDYAFQMRLSRVEPGSYEVEQRKRWKNVDILEGKTLWAGLSILGPGEVKAHFTALQS